MAKQQKEYTCTVEYTEGCEQRLTEALVDIYYQRKRNRELENVTDDKTAQTVEKRTGNGQVQCLSPARPIKIIYKKYGHELGGQ